MHSQEKKVIKNSIYIYILSFFATVAPMLTIPYVTRVLGADGYGEFSIAFNLVNYFQLLTEFGFALHGARKIAVSKTRDEINKCFSNIFFARMMLCGLSMIILTAYLLLFVKNRSIILCVTILFLMVLGSMFQQNWLLQGVEKMQYITGISVVSRIISVALIFLWVNSPDDIYKYCFFYALTNFLVGIGGFVFVFKVLRVRLVRVTVLSILEELKAASYTFVSTMGGKMITSFGITVLGVVDIESSVGIYCAINKVPNILSMLFMPIGQAIYPYVSRKYSESYIVGQGCVKKIAVPVMVIFSIMSIFIFVYSDVIIDIVFGPEYITACTVLRILMIWVLFSILNNFLGIQTLVASNHSKEYGTAFTISSIVSMVANIIIVNILKATGVAIAALLSEMTLTCAIVYFINKINRQKREIN